ncbi:cyanophycinase [Thalassotalea ponticola]|uniref:cyanophycinase n=1 Tax=Thalassotalea ponticola TaxID=1523392 RepID=UPI0025B51576|nr:cyanophycinase [Thalassotalea ponticola]MDN3651607.1 cyanophycinase [Thalassotalea ponticola]
MLRHAFSTFLYTAALASTPLIANATTGDSSERNSVAQHVSKTTPTTNTQSVARSKLFLVGGGLKTCSSLSKSQCNDSTPWSTDSDSKTTSYYQFSDLQQTLLHQHKAHFSTQEYRAIESFFTQMRNTVEDKLVTKAEFSRYLKQSPYYPAINALNDFKYYLLHDLLEVAVNKDGKRLHERVNLSHSNDVFSKELYRQFVDYAKTLSNKAQPNVVVLTASARDPFEAADFYQQVFSQAGANSQWLPLDATLNKAWQLKAKDRAVCATLDRLRLGQNGSTNRQAVYPDLFAKQQQFCQSPQQLIDIIANADGLFINGGDQSLTRKAFVNEDGSDNAVLALIKHKLNRGGFIVGGTSAGTAVMSGGEYLNNNTVMISNGTSETALQRGAKADVLPIEGCQKTNQCKDDLINTDLTYRSDGGIGLVNFAIMDTHFSERGRQGRVAVLAEHTQVPFVLGVDEATAAVIDWSVDTSAPINLRVVGAHGVFVLQPKNENQALIHYINRNDSAQIRQSEITVEFNNPSPSKPSADKTFERANDVFDADNFKRWATQLCRQPEQPLQAQYTWQGNTKKVALALSQNSKTHLGEVRYLGESYQYCSYSNVLFTYR